jgi:hypothetical protein
MILILYLLVFLAFVVLMYGLARLIEWITGKPITRRIG